MPIEVRINYTKRTLQVGEYLQDTPQVVNKAGWAKIALDINIENPQYSADELRSDAMFKAYRDAAVKLWVLPQRREILKQCVGSDKQLNQSKLIDFWNNLDADSVKTATSSSQSKNESRVIDPLRVQRRMRDQVEVISSAPALKAVTVQYGDMEHVLPILQFINTGEGREARGILGKSLWSAVNKNTEQKNKALVAIASTMGLEPNKEGIAAIKQFQDMKPDQFNVATSASVADSLAEGTLTLKDLHFANVKYDEIVKGSQNPKAETFETVVRIMDDIARMSHLFEGKVRPPSNFRPKDIFARHADYIEKTKSITNASTEKFGAQILLDPVLRLHSGTATLLNSTSLMINEGARMGHCIAGYAKRSMQGRYAAYHLVDNEKKHSTLGLYMRDYSPDGIDQHRGPANRAVSQLTKKLCGELIATLAEKHENYSSIDKRAAAQQVMTEAEVSQTNPVENRMADLAARLEGAKEDGSIDMNMFLKSDSEIETDKASTDQVEDDMAKGVAAYTDHMLNNSPG